MHDKLRSAFLVLLSFHEFNYSGINYGVTNKNTSTYNNFFMFMAALMILERHVHFLLYRNCRVNRSHSDNSVKIINMGQMRSNQISLKIT